MKTSLSLLWLDDSFRVVRIDYQVKPWRIRFCGKAKHIIEYEFGTIPFCIKKGDKLHLHYYD